MPIVRRVDGSTWQLLQMTELPDESWCTSVANERQQHIWHAWNRAGGFCDYHHLGGLKAPVARVVANRRTWESRRLRRAEEREAQR